MRKLFKPVLVSIITLFFISGAAISANDSTEVDGIPATLKKEGKATIVILDTKHGKNRGLRRQQAERAAQQMTGCKATAMTGTVFDFQGKGERPVYVQVKLKC